MIPSITDALDQLIPSFCESQHVCIKLRLYLFKLNCIIVRLWFSHLSLLVLCVSSNVWIAGLLFHDQWSARSVKNNAEVSRRFILKFAAVYKGHAWYVRQLQSVLWRHWRRGDIELSGLQEAFSTDFKCVGITFVCMVQFVLAILWQILCFDIDPSVWCIGLVWILPNEAAIWEIYYWCF